jgi:hypothetical protein
MMMLPLLTMILFAKEPPDVEHQSLAMHLKRSKRQKRSLTLKYFPKGWWPASEAPCAAGIVWV